MPRQVGMSAFFGRNRGPASTLIDMSERGVAVRQGLRFLRTELPRILATPPDVLSPRMVRTIEDLASDWHRLDERVEDLSGHARMPAVSG